MKKIRATVPAGHCGSVAPHRHAERLVQPVEKIRIVLPQGAGREKPDKVGSRKGKPPQFWAQADQKALRWDLSEIGDQLNARYSDTPFAACYFVREDGKRQWSLRSRGNFDK